ncbi:MAG: hypothetical protein QM754_08260 [Tepidisphaeraceae bacterium]
MPNGFSFVPSADAKLLEWSAAFKTQIVATPTAFGLVAAQATAYATLHDAYAAALTVATNKTTRTESTVATKNLAKKNLQVNASSLGGMIQKNLTVTDAQKLGLGLTVRAQPQPIPAPSSQPAIEVLSVMGKTVTVRFKSTETIGKRGRPAGTIGLQVYSLIAPEASGNPADWRFEATTSSNLVTIAFPESTPPGTQVWITGSWVSPRLQTGPAANPVTTHLQFGNTIVAMPQQTRKRRAA